MIDVPTVLADLQAIVAEYGDGYVYNDGSGPCVYIRSDFTPGCIVGHVLARHGLLLSRSYARQNVSLNPSGCDPNGVADDRAKFYSDFTPEAVLVLAAAQTVQDRSDGTWGEALIAAKEAAQ